MNKLIPCLVALAPVLAAQETFPLRTTTPSGSTNATEGTAPFKAPLRMTQTKVVDHHGLVARGLPATMNVWDMSDFDPTGRYIFTPSESGNGCGVFRYDQQTGDFAVLMAGVLNAPRMADPATWNPALDNYARLDPCTYTPAGSIIAGEETTGGRLFEVTNPMAAGGFQVRWLSKVPAVAHEGLRFDRDGNLYFIDEDNSGSIYKFVPTVRNDLSTGQTFVLCVDAYAAHPAAQPAQTWNSTANRQTSRFGQARWVPMTDAAGNPLTTANPFVFVTATGGRIAADELFGTPYGRPEDMDINTLANGNQCLYIALTSENRVMSLELTGATTAMARVFCDFDTIDLATGTDVNPLQNDPYTSPGSGTVFNNPDNIAVDAWGSIYVIEDADPGDIWKCVDADRDGVAEAMGLFLSLGVSGSEPSGMVFDPVRPYRFIVNVQHPASGNDATWAFETRPYAGSNGDLQLATGVNAMLRTGPGEFVKSARGMDVVELGVRSPDGALRGRPFALLLQAVGTQAGALPFLPPLWMSPYLPMVPVAGGLAGQFPMVLPQQGSATALQVPPFLRGISVICQGVAVSADGALICSDAHEIVLR